MHALLMPIASLFVYYYWGSAQCNDKEDQDEGKLQGIKFPRSQELYLMAVYIVYIDDTNFIIK
jgi:hypothetical protein